VTATEILEYVRRAVGDAKGVSTRVVNEIVNASRTVISTGEACTIYYTENMPITDDSETEVAFLGGRWDYEVTDSGTEDTRWVKFVSESGAFILYDTATEVTSGDTVRLTYSYDAQNEYTYRDCELKEWIKAACYWMNEITSGITAFSVTGSIYDDTFGIDPEPSWFTGQVVSKRAQYEIRKSQESESDLGAIYVKQGPIVVDTTKGGKDRSDNLKSLSSELDDLIMHLKMGSIRGARIDLYSTYDDNVYDQGYYREINEDDLEA
jgi:hypothetical protein